MTEIALIGIDWGNTGFRAWVFDPSGEAVSAYAAQDGVALSDQDPWIRLADHFESWGGAWPDVPIIVCGAAGGEMGLEDVGYLERLPRGGEIRSVERDGRVVHIVPGVKQGFPPDTMRGEETLLVGLERPDGLVCLPGTHVKHVECDNGEVVWSKTSMVGEMRAMLLDRSTL
ncbi:MAG: 2-dehydro-3-deoxygalactonokinase, partial [Pseudomonadota bacterium]